MTTKYKKTITIKKRKIGDGQPVFIVAEVSGNHNQNYERAIKIIDAACEAGVDAIKLQTYTADTLTIDSDKKWFQVGKGNIWAGQTLYDLYKTAYTPWDWQPKLKKYAEKKGVMLFSTPFDKTAVDFLEKMEVPCYKIASFEIGDIELLKKIGQTKKPVIMSHGMASLADIKLAIKTLKQNGTKDMALLHCVSAYPSKSQFMNLSTIPDLARKFKLVAGLSDHTLGITAAVTSVALGAKIIEKHVTLRRVDGGPDAEFSLEPNELKELVKSVREAEAAIGKPSYGVTKIESFSAVFKRSLFVVKDIKKGENFTQENIHSIRPGYGLEPKYLDKIIGKVSKSNIERGVPLQWNHIKR